MACQNPKPAPNHRNRIQKHSNNGLFEDSSFSPSTDVLCISDKIDQSGLQWLRPHQISCESTIPWTVFRTIMPSDIMQGTLGNCWLLSAMAVLAEREDLVKNIILTKEYSNIGRYDIKLCIDGKWERVTVDDRFPCDKYKRLIYSQAGRNQLWVPLIEKAMAKYYGSYKALVSGRTIEGLSTLTGAPCETVRLQKRSHDDDEVDKDFIWVKILSSKVAGFLMGASCGGFGVQEAEFKRKGLNSNHAYSVLDVQELDNGVRLVRLRNPWGHHTWNGDWCNLSEKWTPELRQKYLVFADVEDEGIFWMSFDDLIKYFDSLDICKVSKDWTDKRYSGYLPPFCSQKYQNCRSLIVLEQTELELTLFQDNQRKRSFNDRSQQDLMAIIFQSNEDGQPIKPVAHCQRETKTCVSLHAILKPGHYLIICTSFNHWETKNVALDLNSIPKCNVTLHSFKPILEEPIQPSKYILADCLIQLIIEKGKKHDSNIGVLTYSLGWCGLFLVVENPMPDKWLHIQCDCSQSFNVVSTRSYVTVDSVPPRHRQIINVLTHFEPTDGYRTSYQMSFRTTRSQELTDEFGDHVSGLRHSPPIQTNVRGLHDVRPF